MPWLPLYMDDGDAGHLLSLLNFDAEIAFIVPVRSGEWIARKGLESVDDGRYCLWHVPSGPLPLLYPDDIPDDVVTDPWRGWVEARPGADPKVPYFGAGHPGVVWWNVRTHSKRTDGGIGLSSFEWIGNRYRAVGSPAHATTETWWKKLRKTVKDYGARRIPRWGPIDGPQPEIWALPSALEKIAEGIARDDNPS